MPKRRYSDDDRANAIAALAANGGFVKTTARQLGIPAKTLENWSKGTRHPEAAEMGDIEKKQLAEALEAVAWRIIKAMPATIHKANLKQLATALGILTDKML